MEKIESIKSSLNLKKPIYNIVFLLAIGIVLIMFGNFMTKDSDLAEDNIIYDSKKEIIEHSYEYELEQKLNNVLSSIRGVGEVTTMVTLEESEEKIIAQDFSSKLDSTDESDVNGGNREINNKENNYNTVFINMEDGSTKPIILKENKPKIEGVIVIADGGGDANIKSNLTKACTTLLGIESHKIQVFQSNKK